MPVPDAAPSAATFVLPSIHDNKEGWGPSADSLPEQFKDIPYAPFSKSDKLGRIVDWNSDPSSSIGFGLSGPGQRGGFRGRPQRDAYGAGQAGQFAYVHDEDEASFNLVGGAAAGARRTGGGGLGGLGRGGARGRGARGARGARGSTRGDRGGFGRGQGPRRGGPSWGRGGWRGDWNDRNSRTRESSVAVGPDWQVLEEIEYSRLQKLRLEVDDTAPQTLGEYGFLHEYDRAYDRINTKNPQALQILDRVRYHPTASEDPVLQELASQNRAQVFTTDSVLSVLMCAPRSVYPWDIVLIREGDKLFLDKREGGPFDFVSVNENAADPPLESEKPDALNTPSNLSLEATFINSNFQLQVVKEDAPQVSFKNANPFYGSDETEPCASAGLRYRKFDLSLDEDDELGVVVRTEVDAVLRGGTNPAAAAEGDSYITVRTLNEFEHGAQGSGNAPNWRAKLDSQRGAVVATEMKNNSSKLAKWAVESILAGAEQMKMGYISRATPRDSSRHVILGQQWFKPRDFAGQINVNLANGWGIARTVFDLALKAPEGKYVLLKDPNKPVIRLYKVPDNAFDAVEEEDEEEDGEESEGELDLGT